MRIKLTVIASLLGRLALGQDFSGLPGCAVPCYGNAVAASGCNDLFCLCTSVIYNLQVAGRVKSSCDILAQLGALAWSLENCAGAKIPAKPDTYFVTTNPPAAPTTPPPSVSTSKSAKKFRA
ncbi:hypothetical protein VTK73DRAFT_4609 [Phialemonium thermophilum]|uniref:CFEM domain-containing protein n=1 Tax=Phialemonium thermophilum TaxID=223376 RepID=A0ABR3XYS1_9PEZI